MRLSILLFSVFLFSCSASRKAIQVINVSDVQRIETILSSDSMEGRKTFTPGIEKAAAFISNEMKQAGLQIFKDATDYLQSFSMINATTTNTDVILNGQTIPSSNVVCYSANTNISFTEADKYNVVRINKEDTFRNKVRSILNKKENTLILVDPFFSRNFKSLTQLKGPVFADGLNKVFILTGDLNVSSLNVKISQLSTAATLANIIGWLPGKSKPNEFVIFSGHYDHLGFERPDSTGDSLYNGANDDASGITAMLMLAKYFKALHSNERSILFVAFTAEEMGGFGSNYFSEHINADEVAAMFNIEMIGTDSKWGSNAAYITGYEKSDLGEILAKNIAGSAFKFYPDPYPAQKLFYRSDNATLARKGVPAHSISTSKMDNEPQYHKPGDEINTLDMKNMTEVIKAIATSAKSIVNGTDTPARIDVSELRR